MAEKVNGSLFKLYVMDGSGTPVEKLITEQLGLTMSNGTNTIDVTSKDNNGYEEFIGGLQTGEVSFDMIMDNSIVAASDKVNYADMSTFKSTRAIKTYKAKLIAPTKTLTITFNALITKFDVGAPMEDKITISVTMKRSGAPTEASTTTT